MDWKTLITDLQASGLTQLEIGKQIGLSQPSVVDVIRGRTKDLKWSVGQALIAMHKAKVGAGGTASSEIEAPAPVRALACASQSVRLTADRRQITRRVETVVVAQPDQLPLVLDGGETKEEAA